MKKTSNNNQQTSESTTEGKVSMVAFLNLDIPLNIMAEMQKFKDMPENKEALDQGAKFADVLIQFGPMTVQMEMMEFIRKLGLLPENNDPIKPSKKKSN